MTSMRPLVADCHFGLGALYRCTGKRDLAREHFATASTMYREMEYRRRRPTGPRSVRA